MTQRKDKCEPTQGGLFSGGYAMIYGSNYAGTCPAESLEGKVVYLVAEDEHGFWDCYDRRGDLVIILDTNLLPISDKDLDDGSSEVSRFDYEARFGL